MIKYIYLQLSAKSKKVSTECSGYFCAINKSILVKAILCNFVNLDLIGKGKGKAGSGRRICCWTILHHL
jgi:hypothetical protein